MNNCNFSLTHLKEIFERSKELYTVVKCIDYFLPENRLKKIFVNRIDVDLDLSKVKDISDLFDDLDIKATFFIRLHGPYNPFSISNLKFLYSLLTRGHEIGLHSEVVDCSESWIVSSSRVLCSDISTLKNFFINVKGVSSHNDLTPYNNQSFWDNHVVEEFGLLYDAYGEMFSNSFYVSDSEVVRWKCYSNGQIVKGENKCMCKHLQDNHQVIYSLIHPIGWR